MAPQAPTDGGFIRELNRELASQPAQTVFPNRISGRYRTGPTSGQVAVGAADFPPRVDLKGEKTL